MDTGTGNDRKDVGPTVKDGWSGRRQGYENRAGEEVDRTDGVKVKGSVYLSVAGVGDVRWARMLTESVSLTLSCRKMTDDNTPVFFFTMIPRTGFKSEHLLFGQSVFEKNMLGERGATGKPTASTESTKLVTTAGASRSVHSEGPPKQNESFVQIQRDKPPKTKRKFCPNRRKLRNFD
jgi:hypothetical protein